MKVDIRQSGQIAIIDVNGQITFENTPVLREKIMGALKDTRSVLVNLSQVAYMDSSGIATLVEGLKGAQERSVGFGLFGLTKTTRNVIELVRLDKVFRIFNSEEEAVRGVSGTPA